MLHKLSCNIRYNRAMVKFKLSLSSFRLCRPKTTHFFSPFNHKAVEIAYPTIPSPPPTTPNYRPHLSKSKTKLLVTTPEMHNSPVSNFQLTDTINKKGTSSDESGWFSNSEGETESVSGSFDSISKKEIYGYSLGGVAHVDEQTVSKMKKLGGGKRRLMRESLTVVKWSEKPYDEFKKSMLEMILEKEMLEAKDLEQLLQCFLCLNSRHHHADIVAAFTEIWELLFL